jgi:Ca2+-transporting ATPase
VVTEGSSSEVRVGGEPAHTLSAPDSVAAWDTDLARGLTSETARQRSRDYGPNSLSEAPPEPWWKRLVAQFKDLVIWILFVAAIISGILQEWVDAVAIMAIVILNGVIGYLQEERAERALAALKKLSAPLAKVLRDGSLASLPASDLVPGDVIDIEAGDNIPADARLVREFALAVQEAALTGESVPVEKDAQARLDRAVPLGDRCNMIYMGTMVARGKGQAVVVATGMQTELGRIAGLLQRQERQPTPLQRRLAELGRVLLVVCLVLVTVIFLLQVLGQGKIMEAVLISVSLAVAAVPEGLPAVVTIALALGVQRMVRRNALVRKLPSVETLGSVTVICSDKTGTLTRNEMTVQEILAGGVKYRLSGTGYVPRGEFFILHDSTATDGATDTQDQAIRPSQQGDLWQALTIGALCNHARLVPPNEDGTTWRIIGDPTEGALVVAAAKAGWELRGGESTVEHELPFESTRKAMSVVIRAEGGERQLLTKGAPEVILSKCTAELRSGSTEPLTEARRREILQANTDMANRALRVLALAYRDDPPATQDEQIEQRLVFVGLAGMIDPPRDEAREAVQVCRDAGIRPVMITGDHPGTAVAVARQLAMLSEGQRAVAAGELDEMDDARLRHEVDHIAVYARASAEHKLRIVKAWRSRGHVVAMTGDGVNDAPAVKAADIGIAMGITGTDVTKEASDMVLTDDNFASIVSAVEEGRGIFDNIRKVLQYLLSCNAGEILLMFVASVLGYPAPLLPIQLLWINLVTDGLPALALSLEPPEPDVMRRRPRRPDESILSPELGLTILWQGLLVGAAALTAFLVGWHMEGGDVQHARAMAFCVLSYDELLRALAARSQRIPLLKLGLRTNPQLLLAIAVSGTLQVCVVMVPFLRGVFGVPLNTPRAWLVVFALAVVPLLLIESTKTIRAEWRSS